MQGETETETEAGAGALEAESEAAVLQYFSELLRRDCGPGPDCAIKTTWRVPVRAYVPVPALVCVMLYFLSYPRPITAVSSTAATTAVLRLCCYHHSSTPC